MAANIGKETTFLMLYPYAIKMEVLGPVLEAFEKKDLTITGLKCMSMRSAEFVKKHFSGPGRTPPKRLRFTVEPMSGATVVVVMLEGEGAIAKGRAVQSGEWATTEDFQSTLAHADTIYCSDSTGSAMEDIALWFPSDPGKKPSDCEKDVVFVLPDGKVQGPWKELPFHFWCYKAESLSEYCYLRDQIFAIIMPVAFQKRRVGDIISVLQRAYLRLKGLKLVDSADFPAIITQSEDNFRHGVAMVLKGSMVNSIQRTTEEDVCYFDPETEVMHYDSKLVYIAESVEKAQELTVRFFPDGYVLFPGPRCRGIFEASLLGL